MASYDDLIEAAAKKYNVDPALVKGVIRTESGGNPKAISSVGAQGLMQIMPGIAKSYGVKNAYDPAQNIDAGTRLLAENLDRFGNVEDALRAYHGGLDKKNWGEKTQAYPGKVMANLNQPKNLPGVPDSAGDADAIFASRFGSAMGAPAKSADAAEQIFAQRFGGALASTPAAKPAAAAPAKITAEWAQKNPAEFQKMLEAGKISPEQWQAITGSTGSVGAGIRDVVSGIVQRGAHTLGAVANAVAPNSGLAKTLNAGNPTLDKQVAQQEQAYQAARSAKGETGMDIGRAVTGAIPMLAATGAPVNSLGGLIAQGVQLGATQGLMTPVTSGNYGEESAKNVALNAAVGGAVPVALRGAYGAGKYVGDVGRSLVAPFTEAGQKEIAANVVNRFASKGAPAQATGELVKGSTPILAESSGNAGIGALTRGLVSANPEFGNQLAMRAAESNAARVNALQGIAGNAETRTAAEIARDQAVKPLYEAATSQVTALDPSLKSLMNRPSMQTAIERAKALAKESGRPFSLGQNVSRPSIAGEGAPKARLAEVSGNDLQTLKMAMDDLLANPQSGIVGKEADAIRSTRNALVDWMEKKIPDFKAARETYSELSKPIAQMDVANRLMQKYSSAVTDLNGTPKLRSESYLRALQDESRLLKNSGAFKGYRGLKDVFTPEQLATIKNVGKDLNRAAVGQNAGRPVGSNTFQNLATSNMLQAAIPGKVGQFIAGAGPGTVGGAVGGGLGFAAGGLPGAAVGGMVGSRVGNLTNQLMATQNEAILGHLGNMLLSGQMPISPAAAAVRGLNPSLRYLSPAVIGLSRQSVVQPQ